MINDIIIDLDNDVAGHLFNVTSKLTKAISKAFNVSDFIKCFAYAFEEIREKSSYPLCLTVITGQA